MDSVSPTDRRVPQSMPTGMRKAIPFHRPGASGNFPGNAPSAAQKNAIAPWEENPSDAAIAPWEHVDPQGQVSGTRPFTADGQPSPFHPHVSNTIAPNDFEADFRRPSVASTSTISSTGSKASVGGRFHKSLKGFFGEDPQSDSRKGSFANLSEEVQNGLNLDKSNRNNSIQTQKPAEERPHTPVPSSDVTPWDYQNFEDVSNFGAAPIRQELRSDKQQNGSSDSASIHSHKKGLLHRHTRSKEDPPTKAVPPSSIPQVKRPSTSRESSSIHVGSANSTPQSATPMSSKTHLGRAPSPPRKDHGGNHDKRGLIARLTHRHKDKDKDKEKEKEKHAPRPQPVLTQPVPPRLSPEVVNNERPLPVQPQAYEAPTLPRHRETSVASTESTSTIRATPTIEPLPPMPPMPRIERTPTNASKSGRFSRHNKPRGISYLNEANEKGKIAQGVPSATSAGIFHLDTDLSDMSEIVAKPPGSAATQNAAPIWDGRPNVITPAQEKPAPIWDAPDSWAVKGQEEEVQNRLAEVSEEMPTIEEEDGISYFMRVFRTDGTFATLSMTINATVAEVLQSLAKKSVLHDPIGNYQLILRKHQLSRQLQPGERPIAMQKKLLLMAGHDDKDRIEDIGREDNSYLCRFTFSHEKQSGFGTGLDNDPGFNKMQKFSHVDLSGRSLVTIPIILYTKAPEIISLNLSRNLALSLPKDFLAACTALKEIKFTGNEAWRLPSSIAHAARLQVLDISNNVLEQLDHAELHKLTNLISLKLANNKLSSLPAHYHHFRQLRSLNISSNNFTTFPEHITHLKALVDLDISFNKLSSLPKISQITTLERLWCTNNELSGPFNEGFKTLVNLKEVDARFNGITNIDNVTTLPQLEQLYVGHNAITNFRGSFKKLRQLILDHNPLTSFELDAPVPTLTSLNLASAKLVEFKETMFEYMPNLQKLMLDKNHLSQISSHIGRLSKLEYLTMAKNPLQFFPPSVGNLVELKHLNLRECNLKSLPPEVWYCRRLETLNVASNVLETFPKQNAAPPPSDIPAQTPGLSSSPSFEELGKLEDFQARRPSQVSTSMLSIGSSPGGGGRKNSIVSLYGPRKTSTITRTNTEYSFSPATRKDSNLSQQRLQNTCAGSLRYLSLADNRLEDDVFQELAALPELRSLNLSYNEIQDIPQGALRRWPQLTELFLSGNELTSLPSDDLEENSNLRVLHLNGNRFQVLPAELCNVHKLSTLDVGSNSLKYNVSNWPYDWNWNRNTALKYLNFSANKRLEIKPAPHQNANQYSANGNTPTDLTSFNTLKYLRILGLMDVTLLINTIPEDSENRRVRTSASNAGALLYGMADTLGKNDHLSTIDLLKPNYRGHDAEILAGMFDGQPMTSGGSKVAKYLHEHFSATFSQELSRMTKEDNATDALRRAFLSLNKDMANYANSNIDTREHRLLANGHRGSTVANALNPDDLNAGCAATILYVNGTELFVGNVGDIEAILIQSSGQHKVLTTKHDPATMKERERIRNAGGYVSRQGKLNDALSMSRAFGFYSQMPSIIAAPSTINLALTESDELIVVASKEFWDYVTVDLAVDVARADRNDLMLAAQKLRDLAIAYGARDKIMVMVLGISDLRKRATNRFRGSTLSMAKELGGDEGALFPTSRKTRRKGETLVGDSKLARLEEPEAPIGDVAIVFTDIKNSTALWEAIPVPMRSAIMMHNELMRRQLRIIGGYEVKTEGDAFMVSFSTVTSALLWCFSCQSHLLELPWPTEILDTVHCQEKFDREGNSIYRGLSVRMGIHYGRPVCEQDPITRRMDYFGPMVNKAARVSAVADGGQIAVSTDYINELQRTLEAYADSDDRRDSSGSQETLDGDPVAVNIRRELRQISSQGFDVKELGEKKLKGLENAEFLYLIYPHGLAGRLDIPPGADDKPPANATTVAGLEENGRPAELSKDSQLSSTGLEIDAVWQLWDIALRLEMLCSCLEDPDRDIGLRKPELSLLDRMKDRGGLISDAFMLNLLEHQVTRVESCVTTLHLRHMYRPLRAGISLVDQGLPIQEVLAEVTRLLSAARGITTNIGTTR